MNVLGRISAAVTDAAPWAGNPDQWHLNSMLREFLQEQKVPVGSFRGEIRAACGRIWPAWRG